MLNFNIEYFEQKVISKNNLLERDDKRNIVVKKKKCLSEDIM